MTLGWLSDAATWASARNRRRNPASSASARCRTFTADPPLEAHVVGHVDATARARADGREQAVPAGEDAAGEIGDAGDRHRVTVPAATSPIRGTPEASAMVGSRSERGVSLGADGRHPRTPRHPRDARRRLFKHPGRVAIVAITVLVVFNLGIFLLNESDTTPSGPPRCPPTSRRVTPEPGRDHRSGRRRQRRPRRPLHRRAR